MKKDNIKEIKPDRLLGAQKGDYFLGNVLLHDISKKIEVKDQKVYFVAFKNGARTKLHYHEGGQILCVTEGKGMLVLYKKYFTGHDKVRLRIDSKSQLKTGDMVYIPKYRFHWHGALKGNNFSHIAFNAFTKKGKDSNTIWYESDFVSYGTKIV
jgi:quercetin dioxygenase-like cupin family protein